MALVHLKLFYAGVGQ